MLVSITEMHNRLSYWLKKVPEGPVTIAGVILSALFPDEGQAQAQVLICEHVMGRVELAAPTLILYEVTNALVQPRRQERISDEQAGNVLISLEGLGIALRPVTWQQILPLALRFDPGPI